MTNPTNPEPKKIQIWLPLLLSLVMVGGMLIGVQLKPDPPQIIFQNETELPSTQLGQGRIEELIRYIEAKYVDDVDSDKMVEEAINSLIGDLDPHSNYISAKSVREVNEQLEGNFEGIGVEFMMLDDTIVVIKPLEGGPSDEAGILAGDRIVTIADSIVAGVDIKIDSIVNKLRGESDSEVEIGVYRKGVEGIKTYTVVRAKIPVNSLDVAYMLDEKTGFIKINRFSASTYREFMEGLEVLVEEHGMEDLVLDLRQNPGGYLQESTKILSQLFKEKGRLLVYTEGRGVKRSNYKSTGQNFFDVDKIIVLIDEGSASASEIVAGAIQDWDRGTIIGRRSYGKGLVQEQYGLRDGSALRLTVARYYTPSDRSIQRPYVDNDNYDSDISDRYKTGELLDSSKIVLADTTVYHTKGGRVVYGGGGIMPDIFVPIDTLELNAYLNTLEQYIPSFVYRYIDAEREDFKSFELKGFKENYEVSEALLEEFINYTVNKKELPKQADFYRIQDLLKLDIKTQIAKYLFDDIGFYEVYNEQDLILQKAMNTLRKDKPLVVK